MDKKHMPTTDGNIKTTAKQTVKRQSSAPVRPRSTEAERSGQRRRPTDKPRSGQTKPPTHAVKSAVGKSNMTRAAKKAPRKKVKRVLTPEQKALLEARRKAKREAVKRMLARLTAVLVIFLTCYLTVSLIIAGLLRANFNKITSDTVRTVKIYQPKKNPENEKEKEKLLEEYISIVNDVDSGLYISYTSLSVITDVSSIGDLTKLTVVFRDCGDVIDCTAFSNSVYINGIPVSLSSPVIMIDGEYYLPVEILEKYSRGVNITTEKDKDGNAYCKIIHEIYGGKISFTNHRDDGTDRVSEPTENNPE